MQLEINKFIQTNLDWEEKLAGPPFHVKTKRDGCFVLLKYDQIRSDFTIPLVRECRGIILDESENFCQVCVPFFKFGNIGESYVPNIDFSTARVQEKLDGSLIKLWFYKGMWHVSSNGEIDAHNAIISSALLTGGRQTNLYTLFFEAWEKTGILLDDLDVNFTYMFELTSPHNRVIVRYCETTIRHIGTRNINTLLECEMDIGIPKPREFPFNTLEVCIESAKQLGYDEEGYVVVDKNYNRVKVKSPLYVALSHLAQGVTTHSNIMEIIKRNEQSEFLAYFPEYRDIFDKIQNRIEAFAAKQDKALAKIRPVVFNSRKALAEVVTKTECPACLFALIDGKNIDAHDWLLARPTAKILEHIGIGRD